MVYLAIGWFLGILFAARAGLPDAVWLAGAVVGAGTAVVLTKRGRAALVVACVAAFFAGGLRHSLAQPQIDQGHVATFNGRDVVVEGVVIAEPEQGDTYVDLTLEAKAIEPEGEVRRAAGGRLRVLAPRFTAAGYGDRVLAKGELETPSEVYGQRAFLAQQNVHSVMEWPEVTRLSGGEGNRFYRAIFTVKARAQTTIERLISGQEAALLSGILLGNDSGLSEGLDEDFQATGMTHIIAISGFNVAVLVGVLLMATRPFLGPARSAAAAMTGVALYTLLVGADASVVRAAIMAGIYLLSSRLLGRPTFPYASLCLAGVGMTLVSPLILWNVGFQLSFAATLGLMLYTDRFVGWTRRRLEGILTKKTARRAVQALSESTLATLAAQITTLPLILYHFETLSLASLPANLLILPAQPGVMTWGGLATLAGMIWPAVGQLFAWVAWLFLRYTTAMVEIMAEMPAATIPVEIGPGGLVALYALIGGVTWAAAQKRGRRSRALAVLAQRAPQGAMALAVIGAALTWQWRATQPDGLLHVAFLDVGQGDAIFIQTPTGRQMLVDGGKQASLLNERLGERMAFWDRDMEIVVATHPDDDHVAGLVDVLNRYRVDALLTNGAREGASEAYDAMLEAAEKGAVVVRRARAGETVVVEDGVRLEIVHPGETLNDGDNDNSVSLRLVYGNFTALLTGDAEEAAEREMVASSRPLQAMVFKAGHHGSRTSSNDFFLAAVRPQMVVISAGKENNLGHPHPEVLERVEAVGAAVLRTDEMGTIEVITDGEQMWWETKR